MYNWGLWCIIPELILLIINPGLLNGLELWWTNWRMAVKHGEAQGYQGMQGMRGMGSRHSLAVTLKQFRGSEWRLYDYITRHFISSLMPDVEYDEKDFSETLPKRWDLESLRNVLAVLDLWDHLSLWKNIVETSRRRWKLMVGKDEPEIHGNHGETARSSVDISWQIFQALIVNVAGEDFCYTFHEMRERPVKINSHLQEDRGSNLTKIDQNTNLGKL